MKHRHIGIIQPIKNTSGNNEILILTVTLILQFPRVPNATEHFLLLNSAFHLANFVPQTISGSENRKCKKESIWGVDNICPRIFKF